MNDKLFKYLAKGIQYLFGVIGFALFIGILVADNNQGLIDWALYLSMTLIWLCLGVIVIAGIYFLITRFRKNIAFLGGLAAFGIIIALSYTLGDGDTTPYNGLDVEVTESSVKWSDAGLISFYIMLAVVLLIIVLGEVRKLISR